MNQEFKIKCTRTFPREEPPGRLREFDGSAMWFVVVPPTPSTHLSSVARSSNGAEFWGCVFSPQYPVSLPCWPADGLFALCKMNVEWCRLKQ
jgi:hypothetical protein